MNCQSFENVATDLARRHPFEATALEEARAHAEGCASCAMKLEAQRSLSVGLRGLSDEMRRVQIPSQEQKLIEALREQMLPGRRAHVITRRWFAVAAVAAVLLVAFGVVALRSRSGPAPAPIKAGNQKPIESNNPSPVVPLAPVMPSLTQENLIRADNQTTRPRRHIVAKRRANRARGADLTAASTATAITNTAAAEVTTEFMPLGDVSVANLQEGAQVVRVEMPRYAMARFGLPVNMERYDEKVKADVWVGADGLARAIRFVQ